MMNNFTDLIKESRSNFDSGSLLQSEVANYINKVNKVIPSAVKDVIYLTQKYNLMDAESLTAIKDAGKSQLKVLAKKYDIPVSEIEDLHKSIKELRQNIKLLPQFQSKQEREALELGKTSMNDLTIDLDSAQGRNAASKMYMPMVYKIVNQYVGKSNLNKQELMSAALQGFTLAMNEWRKGETEGDDKGKKVLFKTYAAYRVKQQILQDINHYGHSLSGTSWYSSQVYGAGLLDAVSIDSMNSDGDEFDQSKLAALGVEDAEYGSANEEKDWNKLYDLIENKFKQRDVDVFYRYFGLKGYKMEKSKDIAHSLGVAEPTIKNAIINKIMNFLRNDKKATDLLQNIQDVYNESLMVSMMGFTREEIMETLADNDMFILLEDLNRWNNVDVFRTAMENVRTKLSDKENKFIDKLLHSDFEFLDTNLKKERKTILLFLSNLYPTENMSRKTDVSILEYIEELQQLCKQYKM